MYFGKAKSKIEVINDIENEIPNLFKIIKYHAPEMKRLLSYEISGRSIFDEYKNATLEHLTDIQRAIRFMYLMTQSFGGQVIIMVMELIHYHHKKSLIVT